MTEKLSQDKQVPILTGLGKQKYNIIGTGAISAASQRNRRPKIYERDPNRIFSIFLASLKNRH